MTNLPENWTICHLDDVLNYEQPQPYIVSNENYSDEYKTPVLTAGKSFIIGKTNDDFGIYDKLPVIIFDDFTTSSQLVNFKFKVKSSAMKILSVSYKDFDIKFFYYLMKTIDCPHDTHKRYWISDFSQKEIPLPPLAEQGRIVQKIEELFADIDAGIQNLKSVQNQIKLYRQSVLKSAFEENLYKSSEWKIVSIQHITSNKKNAIKAGPFGSALKKDTYTKNGYKIYGQEQVIRGDAHFGDYYISKEKYNELYSCHVKPNDILISLVGTIGKVLILPEDAEDGIINPRLIKISLDPQKYLTKFFKFYFESVALKSQYKKEAHGQTMEVLNLGLIKKLSFPLPSLEEQERIVAEIERRFERADELEKAVNAALADAEKLKQSVLKKAFRGELVEQNPDDEPAAVLLDRIRAERAAAPKSPKKGKRK